MPTSQHLPTYQTWKKLTTDSRGGRMIQARGCDVYLDQYEKASGLDFKRIPEILNKLLDKVLTGLSQSQNNEYLTAQFKALHFNVLQEMKVASQKKQQIFRPDAGKGGVSLGWHRERTELKGMYAVEGHDPKHRFGMFWGTAARLKGVSVPTNQEEFQALYNWANENESLVWQHLSPTIRNSYVAYLDPQGRWKYRLMAENKKVLQNDEKGKPIPFDTRECSVHDPYTGGQGRAIWVMGKNDGEWYGGSHITGKFHHSSFLSGDLVVCGGEMVCKRGTPLFISNKTGHYQAGPRNLYNALRRICLKVDMDSVRIALNMGNEMELWTTFAAFMKAEGLINRLGGVPISTKGMERIRIHQEIQYDLKSDTATQPVLGRQRSGSIPSDPDYGYVGATWVKAQYEPKVSAPNVPEGKILNETESETEPVPITQVSDPAYYQN